MLFTIMLLKLHRMNEKIESVLASQQGSLELGNFQNKSSGKFRHSRRIGLQVLTTLSDLQKMKLVPQLTN